MTRLLWVAVMAACTAACDGDAAETTAGAAGAGGEPGSGGGGGSPSTLACDDLVPAIESYKASHPGNGGKDWDFNTKTEEEIAADPATKDLRDLCGLEQRPVIPLLAWEYGGNDHPWISPESSAFYYCVHVPVSPGTDHWAYDAVADHVTADVSIGCPAQNPCNAEVGADQVMSCLGDPSNIEIIVDMASLNDGADAGLSLSEASTDLYLILEDQTKVHLYFGE